MYRHRSSPASIADHPDEFETAAEITTFSLGSGKKFSLPVAKISNIFEVSKVSKVSEPSGVIENLSTCPR